MKIVSEAPKTWELKAIGSFIEELESGVSVNSSKQDGAQGWRILKTSCVSYGRFDSAESKPVVQAEIARLRCPVRKGSIVISRMNTPDLVGANAYVKKEAPGVFLPDRLWQTVWKRDAEIVPSWLAQLLGSPMGRTFLKSIASGTSDSMKNISKEAFLSAEAPTPPLPEQKKIAGILSTWDEALEKLDALIAAKDRRKRAFMQQFLTGKRRLEGFFKPWLTSRFEQLFHAEDRYVTFDDEHTYSLVSIRRRAGGVFFREELQGSKIKTKVMKQVHQGDFLISRMQVVHGALGMVRAECDGMFASDSYDVLVAHDPEQLHMPFLDWLSRLRSFWRIAYICSHGVHIEKMTFNLDDFMREKITIPASIEEQRAIAAILDTCDEELRLFRTQRTVFDRQKRGLMQRLLTGKVRVKITEP